MTAYIILLSYNVSLEEIMKCVPAHREYLESFYRKEMILFSGIQCSKTGGIIVMRASSEKEVEELISGDPFNRNNLASYQTIPFEARAWQPFIETWLKKG